MKFSIIIPVYNDIKYFEDCLKSVVHQNYDNYEVIIVDDGSYDGSQNICDMYANNYSFVKVIHKPNGGLVSARKAGLKIAKGDYISYVDSDDWIDRDCLKNIEAILEKNICDVLVTGLIFEYEDGTSSEYKTKYIGMHYKDDLKSFIYKRMIYDAEYMFFQNGISSSLCNKWFRREIILDNQLSVPDAIVNGEDDCCTYKSLIDSQTVYISDYIYYHCRINKFSMSRKTDVKRINNAMLLYDYLKISLPCHLYDLDNQINVLIANIIYKSLINLLDSKTDYIKKKELIIKFYESDETRMIINEAKISKATLKARIMLWLMKNKKVHLVLMFFNRG